MNSTKLRSWPEGSSCRDTRIVNSEEVQVYVFSPQQPLTNQALTSSSSNKTARRLLVKRSKRLGYLGCAEQAFYCFSPPRKVPCTTMAYETGAFGMRETWKLCDCAAVSRGRWLKSLDLIYFESAV